jgi:hypothetical protein
MFIVLALFVTIALVQSLEFPAAKQHASMWKLDLSASMDGERELTMRLPLAPRNAAELTEKVNSIGNPKSANFRKYLTNKQITELVGASESDMEKVLAWAQASNFRVVEIPQNRDWVTVSAPISSIEKSLKTKLGTWTNEKTGQVRFVLFFTYSFCQANYCLVRLKFIYILFDCPYRPRSVPSFLTPCLMTLLRLCRYNQCVLFFFVCFKSIYLLFLVARASFHLAFHFLHQ